MKPQVMVSSVTKDRIPLGNISTLAGVWFESEKLGDRLKAAGLKSDAGTLVPFEFIRSEIKRHLVGKHAWEVYLFEDKAGQRSGEQDTLDATKESQLVIGIFGQDTGWHVGGHDPLTSTLREWRKALATPLKFRLFWWKDSVPLNKLSGETSPILSNIYLHYVLDLWFSKKVKPACAGEAHLTRFADDFVVSFQYQRDAERFHQSLTDRFREFGLELAEEKTGVKRFGRFAGSDLAKLGRKPDTFDFLGFTHVCGTDSKGRFMLIRVPCVKSCRKFLAKSKEWLRENRHRRRRDQRQQLMLMLRGFYQYLVYNHCKAKLDTVRLEVQRQ